MKVRENNKHFTLSTLKQQCGANNPLEYYNLLMNQLLRVDHKV
jgi:hypothetical protein